MYSRDCPNSDQETLSIQKNVGVAIQLTFAWLKSVKETLEKGVKCIQS